MNENEIPESEDTNENEAVVDEVNGKADEKPVEVKTPEMEIAELKDRLLRSIADAENIRRRSERQIGDAAQYAVTGFARELLSVADNLRRTLEGLPDELKENEGLKVFIEGLEMTERELLNIFDKQGIKKISPLGEKFDHNFHQAMFEVESADAETGTILQVIQPGYTIKDRLLRPAMVGVVKNLKKPEHSVDESA